VESHLATSHQLAAYLDAKLLALPGSQPPEEALHARHMQQRALHHALLARQNELLQFQCALQKAALSGAAVGKSAAGAERLAAATTTAVNTPPSVPRGAAQPPPKQQEQDQVQPPCLTEQVRARHDSLPPREAQPSLLPLASRKWQIASSNTSSMASSMAESGHSAKQQSGVQRAHAIAPSSTPCSGSSVQEQPKDTAAAPSTSSIASAPAAPSAAATVPAIRSKIASVEAAADLHRRRQLCRRALAALSACAAAARRRMQSAEAIARRRRASRALAQIRDAVARGRSELKEGVRRRLLRAWRVAALNGRARRALEREVGAWRRERALRAAFGAWRGEQAQASAWRGLLVQVRQRRGVAACRAWLTAAESEREHADAAQEKQQQWRLARVLAAWRATIRPHGQVVSLAEALRRKQVLSHALERLQAPVEHRLMLVQMLGAAERSHAAHAEAGADPTDPHAQDFDLMHACMQAWEAATAAGQAQAQAAAAEAAAVALRDTRLMVGAFAGLRGYAETARRQQHEQLAGKAFTLWRGMTAVARERRKQAAAADAFRGARLARQALHGWRVFALVRAERRAAGTLAEDHAKGVVMSRVLRGWRSNERAAACADSSCLACVDVTNRQGRGRVAVCACAGQSAGQQVAVAELVEAPQLSTWLRP